VILDVFSRYVVGWMVADGESSELAKRLIADLPRSAHPFSVDRFGVERRQAKTWLQS
jgi:transposase InsO family protein